ncbi:hypothetical protein GGS20DRAFT_264845 [Poronia punctata]|nr:hypothetical protein GGS20DRAFT_264845 [Poronia punctata]
METLVNWLLEAFPSVLWNMVGWVAFLCKLASLAFAVPFIGLIIFDFCVWLWRLYKPSLHEPPRTSRLHRDRVAASSSAIDVGHTGGQQLSERQALGRTSSDNT